MIITLKGANFSASNIGTLSTWRISTTLGAGATYSGATIVNKGAALTATVTIADGYELGSAGVTVTMGGSTVNAATVSGNTITISIASVTGNVVIKVPTKGTVTGEETLATYTSLLPTTTTTGYYINSYLENKAMAGSFNIAKMPVKPGMSVTISARVGGAAAICWTDSAGKRTLLTMGNSGEGVNVNITEIVPDGVAYLECSYATGEAFSVTAQKEFTTISTPAPVSTTTGKYINKSCNEATMSGMNYDTFTVSEGQWYYIVCRSGNACSAITWVDASGNKTMCLGGNSNDGVNIDIAVYVPSNVSSMIISYSTSEMHSVALIKEA